MRAKEFDVDLCRLAFFLDPRFRKVASASKMAQLQREVCFEIDTLRYICHQCSAPRMDGAMCDCACCKH